MKRYETLEVPLSMEWGSEPVVRGAIVDVAPHLLATFIVHRHSYRGKRFWRLTNVETGLCVGAADRPTKEGCVRAARRRLARVTPATHRKAVATALRNFDGLREKLLPSEMTAGWGC